MSMNLPGYTREFYPSDGEGDSVEVLKPVGNERRNKDRWLREMVVGGVVYYLNFQSGYQVINPLGKPGESPNGRRERPPGQFEVEDALWRPWAPPNEQVADRVRVFKSRCIRRPARQLPTCDAVNVSDRSESSSDDSSIRAFMRSHKSSSISDSSSRDAHYPSRLPPLDYEWTSSSATEDSDSPVFKFRPRQKRRKIESSDSDSPPPRKSARRRGRPPLAPTARTTTTLARKKASSDPPEEFTRLSPKPRPRLQRKHVPSREFNARLLSESAAPTDANVGQEVVCDQPCGVYTVRLVEFKDPFWIVHDSASGMYALVPPERLRNVHPSGSVPPSWSSFNPEETKWACTWSRNRNRLPWKVWSEWKSQEKRDQ